MEVQSDEPILNWPSVENHTEKKWNWGFLSLNRSLPWDLVEKHPDWKWNWGYLSENPSLPWHLVEKHPNWNWDWWYLSYNPSLPWSLVEKHPNWKWDWRALSGRGSLDIHFVAIHPEFPWSFKGLLDNMFDEVSLRQRVKRYAITWRQMNQERRRNRRELFDPTLDLLRMRIRDREVGIRPTLTNRITN